MAQSMHLSNQFGPHAMHHFEWTGRAPRHPVSHGPPSVVPANDANISIDSPDVDANSTLSPDNDVTGDTSTLTRGKPMSPRAAMEGVPKWDMLEKVFATSFELILILVVISLVRISVMVIWTSFFQEDPASKRRGAMSGSPDVSVRGSQFLSFRQHTSGLNLKKNETSSLKKKVSLSRSSTTKRAMAKQWRLVVVASRIQNSIKKFLDKDQMWMMFLPYVRMGFSLLICILYVAETYWKTVPRSICIFQKLVGIVLLSRYILRYIVSLEPLLFVLIPENLGDLISLVSLLYSEPGLWVSLNFLQMHKVMAIYTTLDHQGLVFPKQTAVNRFFLKAGVQGAGFMYIVTCGLQMFELVGDPSSHIEESMFTFTWANTLYFTIITIATVGFGDFVPKTLLGRMATVTIIITGVYLVSRSVTRAIEVTSYLRSGMGSYTKGSKEHVVVGGNLRWTHLKQFLLEFYADPAHLNIDTVVLCTFADWKDETWNSFINANSSMKKSCIYLEGTLGSETDLERAKVHFAAAAFVLCHPHAPLAYREDAETMKCVLSVRNHAPSLPIYALIAIKDSIFQVQVAMQHDDGDEDEDLEFMAMVHRATSLHTGLSTKLPNFTHHISELRGNFASFDNQMVSTSSYQPRANPKDRKSSFVCMQQLEVALVSNNLFCNGVSTMLSNLLFQSVIQPTTTNIPWLFEYKIGASMHLEFVEFPRELKGFRCLDVVMILYDFGLLCIAIQKDELGESYAPEFNASFGVDLSEEAALGDVPDRKRPRGRVWKPIKKASVISKGVLGVFITYHTHEVVQIMLKHAAKLIAGAGREAQNSISSVDSDSDQSAYEYGTRRSKIPGKRGSLPSHESEDDEEDDMFHHLFRDGPIDFDEVAQHYRRGASEQDPKAGVKMRERDSEERSISVVGGVHVSAPADENLSPLAQAADLSSHGAVGSSSRNLGAHLGESEKPSGVGGVGHLRKGDPFGGTLHGLAKMRTESETDSESEKRRGLEAFKREMKMVYIDEKLPTNLRGHIILCMVTASGLRNLEYIMHSIWQKRPSISQRSPIVVIYPSYPPDLEKQFSRFKGMLYFIEGMSSSLRVLKHAQYDKARSIVMASTSLNDSRFGFEDMDSESIFTVMTLDFLLEKHSDTFVCCTFDSEDTVRYLRAPSKPRRKHVQLGSQVEAEISVHAGSDDEKSSEDSMLLDAPEQELQRFKSRSLLRQHEDFSSTNLATMAKAGPSDKRPARGVSWDVRGQITASGGTERMASGAPFGETAAGGTLDYTNPRTTPDSALDAFASDEMEERQRYASGEMVMSSFYISLLVKEFSCPGILGLVQKLLGTQMRSKQRKQKGKKSSASGEMCQSWIRLLDIPTPYVEEAEFTGGRTYRDVFSKMLSFNCIALGLYRSGRSPVRVPTEVKKPSAFSSGTRDSGAGLATHVQATSVPQSTQSGITSLGASNPHLDETVMRSTSRVFAIGSELRKLISMDDEVLARKEDYGATAQAAGTGTSGADTGTNIGASKVSRGNANIGTDSDIKHYVCPTTGRTIMFEEIMDADNMLPYVYTNPEPYTLVTDTDGVFVMCHPEINIPVGWGCDTALF